MIGARDACRAAASRAAIVSAALHAALVLCAALQQSCVLHLQKLVMMMLARLPACMPDLAWLLHACTQLTLCPERPLPRITGNEGTLDHLSAGAQHRALEPEEHLPYEEGAQEDAPRQRAANLLRSACQLGWERASSTVSEPHPSVERAPRLPV